MTSRARRCLLSFAAATAWLAFGSEASAYCRTTTCDTGTQDCTKNDDGCVRDGVPVVWTTTPIVYRFYAGGSSKLDDGDMRKAVKAAFKAWSSVQCAHGKTSVTFSQGPDIQTDKPLKKKEASEPFGIYFRDDSWPHDDADESLALTNQDYGTRFGDIDYADIEVNTANTDFVISNDDSSDGIDFQSVMTHEAGHYLGLAHSTQEDSIMVARYCASANRCSGDLASKRALAADDIAAVCAVYPPTDGSGTAATDGTTAGCAQVSHTKSELAERFGLVFLVSAILRRRLRRRR